MYTNSIPGIKGMHMFAGRLFLSLVDVYTLVLIARILFSWAPAEWRANDVYDFIFAITEPLMRPFRRILPPAGGIDFSPILLFLAIAVVHRLLREILL
jgi:YggT family protein